MIRAPSVVEDLGMRQRPGALGEIGPLEKTNTLCPAVTGCDRLANQSYTAAVQIRKRKSHMEKLKFYRHSNGSVKAAAVSIVRPSGSSGFHAAALVPGLSRVSGKSA